MKNCNVVTTILISRDVHRLLVRLLAYTGDTPLRFTIWKRRGLLAVNQTTVFALCIYHIFAMNNVVCMDMCSCVIVYVCVISVYVNFFEFLWCLMSVLFVLFTFLVFFSGDIIILLQLKCLLFICVMSTVNK